MTSRGAARWVWLALILTALAGVTMRWALAGITHMPWDFVRLRHAHGHLAYYGCLVPLAWWVWHGSGVRLPAAGTLAAYGLAVVVSILGFLTGGYALASIVGSTVVGAIWLASSWRVRSRLWRVHDPLGVILPGMIVSLACVPFVARFTRREPALGQQWVATFLAAMLLLVVLPSCLAALRVKRPWPALLLCGALGAAALGVWPSAWARLGLLGFAALVWPAGKPFPPHLRLVWAGLSVGIAAMAVGLVPNVRPVIIGAVHFMALSACLPVLLSALRVPLSSPLWWLHHAAVALLCVPIALQAWGFGAWTYTAAAAGGTGVLAGLVAMPVVLFARGRGLVVVDE